MALGKKVFLLLGSIGRGLAKNNVTNLLDVLISADGTNALGYGTDNGLVLTKATIIANALPTVTAAQQGATLAVTTSGTWGVNPFSGPITSWPPMPGM